MNDDLDPRLRSAYNRLMDSCAAVEAATLRADNTPVVQHPNVRLVTEELLSRLASSSRASPELRAYAADVDAGMRTWDRIEIDAQPNPPEVAELKADPRAEWPPNWPPPADGPYRIDWQ